MHILGGDFDFQQEEGAHHIGRIAFLHTTTRSLQRTFPLFFYSVTTDDLFRHDGAMPASIYILHSFLCPYYIVLVDRIIG